MVTSPVFCRARGLAVGAMVRYVNGAHGFPRPHPELRRAIDAQGKHVVLDAAANAEAANAAANIHVHADARRRSRWRAKRPPDESVTSFRSGRRGRAARSAARPD